MRLAAPVFAGALLLALPAGTMSEPEAESIYSLVTGREIAFLTPSRRCITLDAQPFCFTTSPAVMMDNGRTLAGPPVPKDFIAGMDDELLGLGRPVLLVLERKSLASGPRVVAEAVADDHGWACLADTEFERLAWRPTGRRIKTTMAGSVCVNLSRLAKLPPGVTVLTANDILREKRREQRRLWNEGRRFIQR